MKSTTLFVICLVATTTLAFDANVLQFLSLETDDAFDDVLNLLYDLKHGADGELAAIESNWSDNRPALGDEATTL